MEITTEPVARFAHDYDSLAATIVADVPDEAKTILDGIDSYRGDRPVSWRAKLGPDMTVLHYPLRGRTRVSGSPHKFACGESVGTFGPDQMTAFARELSWSLGIPFGNVMDAQVSRFDIAVNLIVDAAAPDYVRLMSPPPQMKEVGSGPGSAAFKNTVAELIVYDKIQKLQDRRLSHLIPEPWRGRHVLRVEARFKRPAKEFGRRVRVADLCSWSFYGEAVERWLHRVDQIALSGEVLPVPHATTPTEMVNGLASIGVHAVGGPAAVNEKITWGQRNDLILARNAQRMRTQVLLLIDGDTITELPNLTGEFRDRVSLAACASLAHAASRTDDRE